jgi:hypothetical protein
MRKKLSRVQKNEGAGPKSAACSAAHTPLGECTSLHFSAKSGADIFGPEAPND